MRRQGCIGMRSILDLPTEACQEIPAHFAKLKFVNSANLEL